MIGAGFRSPEGRLWPKCSAKRSGSMVAEVMMIFRSGRWGRIWRRYPMITSMLRDRSWASSMMIAS